MTQKIEKPTKVFFIISAALFLVTLLFGYIAGKDSGLAESVLNTTFGPLDKILNGSDWTIFFFVFLNNSLKALFAILLGFGFAIFPVYSICANGWMLGLFARYFVDLKGGSFAAAGLLPHGILEIAGFVIAIAYGIWLGYRFWLTLRKKAPFKPYFVHALLVFLKIVLPILLLSATIEVFVTPRIIDLVR
jgi:stage II sporulation protein M